MNGVEQKIDASEGLNEELIRQMADQAGVSLEHAMHLLALAKGPYKAPAKEMYR